jgi:hypothetical protein
LEVTAPTFVTISGDDLVVQPSQVPDIGLTSFIVTIALADYPSITATQTVNLAVVPCIVISMSPAAIPVQSYTIGNAAITFGFDFQESPTCPAIVYSLNSSPAFISLDQTAKTISVQSANKADAGTY